MIALAVGGTAVLGGGGFLLYRAAVGAGTKSAQAIGIAEAAAALAPAMAGIGQGVAGLGQGIGQGVSKVGGAVEKIGGGVGTFVGAVGQGAGAVGGGAGSVLRGAGSAISAPVAVATAATRSVGRGAQTVAQDAYKGGKTIVSYANPVTAIKGVGNAVKSLKFW